MNSINTLLANPLSLEWLLRNRGDYEHLFTSNYLPDSKIENNILYVKKCKEIIQKNTASENYKERIIFLDTSGKVIPDHESNDLEGDRIWYPIPHDGYMVYLMWTVPYGSGNYYIEYIVDINSVHVEKDFENIKDGISIGLSFTSFDINEMPYKEMIALSTILSNEDKEKIIFNKFLKEYM